MPEPSLEAVAGELAALAGDDRRAILAALDADDRARVLAVLKGRKVEPPYRPPPPGPHSAWFDALLAEAGDEGGPVTAAARAALIDAVGQRRGATPARMPGRSLLQAASGLLSQGRAA